MESRPRPCNPFVVVRLFIVSMTFLLCVNRNGAELVREKVDCSRLWKNQTRLMNVFAALEFEATTKILTILVQISPFVPISSQFDRLNPTFFGAFSVWLAFISNRSRVRTF